MRVFVLLLMVATQWAVQALTVTNMVPAPGSTPTAPPSSIVVTFSDPVSVSGTGVLFTRAGLDGIINTADDIVLTPTAISVSTNQLTLDLTGMRLPNDIYRVRLRSGTGVAATNLVGHWKFNENSGAVVSDSSANAFNGGINGAVSWIAGVEGAALNFNGTSTFVEVPDNPALSPTTNDFTITAWVKPATPDGGWRHIFTKDRDTDPNHQYVFALDPSNRLNFNMTDNVNGTFPFFAPAALPANTWSHVAITRSGANHGLYVNGELVASKSVAALINNFNTRNLRIGARYAISGSGPAALFKGGIDDVRYYFRQLSAGELLALTNGGVTDTSGNRLDGAYPGGGGGFPSGDGSFADFVADFTLQTPCLQVTALSFTPGGVLPSVPASLIATFNRNPDPLNANNSTVQVDRAGPDATFDTGDDVVVTPSSYNVVGSQLTIGLPGGLPPNLYRLKLRAAQLVTGNLKAYYRFDEGSGTTAFDSSGSIYTGNITGGVSYVPGVSSTALNFNGTDTYIDIPSTATVNVGQTDFTIAAWIKLTPDVAWRHIFTKERDADPTAQFNFGIDPANNVYFTFTNLTNDDGTFPFTGSSVANNTWTHVAVTRKGKDHTLYVNGVPVATKTTATVINNANGYNMRTGGRYATSGSGADGNGVFNGAMDDVRMYFRALSTAEIVQVGTAHAISDLHDNVLDGEYPGGGGGLPSGNGTAGGDFAATFRGNAVPVATPQSVSTHGNTAKPIVLSGTDGDNDMLTFSVVTPPVNGLLSGTEPNLTYTPTAGYIGSDSFTFRANDGLINSTPATINIDVTNQAPTATPQSITAHGGTGKPVVLTGTDPDTDALTFSVVTPPTQGLLSGTPPNLTYTATVGYLGGDSFTFRANDGFVNSAAVTVSINVTNEAPEAVAQTLSTHVDTARPITLTGTDADNDPLTFTIIIPPVHGTLSGTPPDMTYTPNTGYFGTDAFGFKANDGYVNSTTAVVSINVTNLPPIASASASPTVTLPGGSVAFTGIGADPDNDLVGYSWNFGDGSPAATTPNATHSYAAVGTYTVTLTVTDPGGLTAQATVTVRVGSGPVAAFTTSDLVGFAGQQLGFDASQSSDADGAIVSYAWSFGDGSAPGSGKEVSHVYAAAGAVTVTLTVTDSDGFSTTASRAMDILPADEFGVFESFVRYGVKFDRAKKNADSLAFEASVFVGDATIGSGTAVVIEIAGRRYAGQLDAKLRDKNGGESWQVAANGKKQSPGEALIKFKATKTSLGKEFHGAGAVVGSDPKKLVEAAIPVRIEIAGRAFELLIDSEFKFGKNGTKASGSGDGPD